MMRSIQARLGIALLLSLLVVFAALWYGVSSAIHYLAEDYIVSRLVHDGENLLAAVGIDADRALSLDEKRIDAIYQRPFSGHYYQIQSGSQVLRSRSLWDQTLALPELSSGKSTLVHIDGPQQQPLLVNVAGFRKQGQAFNLAVAEDLTAVEADIAAFQRKFAITAGVALFVLVAIQGVIIRLSMNPLTRLRGEVRALERGERQTLGTHIPREVVPLVEEINRLLVVLDKRLKRYRNALGDLAHALKRPLTVMQQQSRDERLRQHPDLAEGLIGQTRAMRRTIERTLQRARLAGEGPPGAHFAVVQDLAGLVDALEHMYPNKSLSVGTIEIDNASLPLDREDMLELLGNLLDNACKWARHKVEVGVRLTAKALVVDIEDDGPGASEADIENLTRRGTRLDETREGQGLGLAIAAEITEQYRGELTLTESQRLGGLAVTLEIPIA
ncbi:MAG: GHKL domain-containing protein [Pseudomonadota bacterium]|nr:MAG: GHKL domain-containing protein [Pseudomonadota bacterium]